MNEEYREHVLESLKGGQNPPLAVIYCSDSRVDYTMFRVGPGSIFTIENAGNVFGLGAESESSLAYALTHFSFNGTFNILVLGHTLCGAVSAACSKYPDYSAVSPRSLSRLLDHIRPAVERARAMEGDLIDNAIRENVLVQMSNVSKFFAGIDNVKAGNVFLYGAVYEISGKDDVLPFAWRMRLRENGRNVENPSVEKIEMKGSERNLDTLMYDIMKIDRKLAKRGINRSGPHLKEKR
ncbi:MAG: carbonic anhydrase [Candidatus Micrarchaeia archaeon]